MHLGHLIAAESVRDALDLEKILFVPAFQPPHKSSAPIAPARLRLRMLEAALQDHLSFEASDNEIQRGGASYTVDTLAELKRSRPSDELYWIIGSDLVAALATWRCWQDIVSMAKIVAVRRPGAELAAPPEEFRPFLRIVDIPGLNISSTDIRNRIAEGSSIRYLVPEAVRVLIESEGLYRGRS